MLFQRKELLKLAFKQLGNRYTCPPAYHFRDVLFVNLFLQQPAASVLFVEPFFIFAQLLLQLSELAVLKFGRAVQIVFALRLLDSQLGLLDLLPNRANLLN